MSNTNDALLDLFPDRDFSNAFDDISFNLSEWKYHKTIHKTWSCLDQDPEADNILTDCLSSSLFDDTNTGAEIGNGITELNQVEIG